MNNPCLLVDLSNNLRESCRELLEKLELRTFFCLWVTEWKLELRVFFRS